MESVFKNYLIRKYRTVLSKEEIEQEIAIAEWKATERVAFTIAKNSLEDLSRKRRVIERHFETLSTEDMDLFNAPSDNEEWNAALEQASPRVRKLIELSIEECNTQTLNGNIEWSRKCVDAMRERIKRRFIDWVHHHSERAYFRTRRELMELLRRNTK